MKKCGNWPIGVCSWSLQSDIEGIARAMSELDINYVHLAVGPASAEDGREYLYEVLKQNWIISSAMLDFPQEDYSSLESIRKTGGIAPDQYWDDNRRRFIRAVEVTSQLAVKYLSMHVGFIDHTVAEYAAKFRDRVKFMADKAAEKNVTLLLETGQESAEELRLFLEQLNHPAIGVNFDPANMLLYDKDKPTEAVEILAPWIKHVHIKDAVRTTVPGKWGTEVVWTDGQVGADEFLKALAEAGFEGVLAVEREAGDDRFGDIKTAIEQLSSFREDIK